MQKKKIIEGPTFNNYDWITLYESTMGSAMWKKLGIQKTELCIYILWRPGLILITKKYIKIWHTF